MAVVGFINKNNNNKERARAARWGKALESSEEDVALLLRYVERRLNAQSVHFVERVGHSDSFHVEQVACHHDSLRSLLLAAPPLTRAIPTSIFCWASTPRKDFPYASDLLLSSMPIIRPTPRTPLTTRAYPKSEDTCSSTAFFRYDPICVCVCACVHTKRKKEVWEKRYALGVEHECPIVSGDELDGSQANATAQRGAGERGALLEEEFFGQAGLRVQDGACCFNRRGKGAIRNGRNVSGRLAVELPMG